MGYNDPLGYFNNIADLDERKRAQETYEAGLNQQSFANSFFGKNRHMVGADGQDRVILRKAKLNSDGSVAREAKGMNASAFNNMMGATTMAAPIVGGLIGGGLDSGAGRLMNGLAPIAQQFGPIGQFVGAGLQVGAGVVNRLAGSSIDAAKVNAAKDNINALNSFNANASNFDQLSEDITNMPAVATIGKVGKDGTFSTKAKDLTNKLRNEQALALDRANNSVLNNQENITMDVRNNLLSNYSAFGGELGTNGADFTNGIININAGGSHEENPHNGVQQGVDPQGVPNLVEEGETIYDDYVFSKRLMVPDDIKRKYKLGGKKKKISYADASKKLAKESEERPNDPISKRGLQVTMDDLRNSQEELKQEKQDAEIINALSQMSPEEQQMALAQMQQQEMAQDPQIQQQLAQEQMMQQQDMQDMQGIEQDPNIGMFAYGGNLFYPGGTIFTDVAPAVSTAVNSSPISPIRHSKRKGTFGGGVFTGAGAGGTFIPYSDYTDYSSAKNFNEAWDNAVRDKQEGFIFNGLPYNTRKENNPIRELNNRWVGAGRKNKGGERDSTYKHQAGPFRYKGLEMVPIVSNSRALGGHIYDGLTLNTNTLYRNGNFRPWLPISKTNSPDFGLETPELQVRPFSIASPLVEKPQVNLGAPKLKLTPSIDPSISSEEEDYDIPIFNNIAEYRPTFMRKGDIWGSIFGISRNLMSDPNYYNSDRLESTSQAASEYDRVSSPVIGNRLTYKPLDFLTAVNQLNGIAGATRRDISNKGNTPGMAIAGITASDYNAMNTFGKTLREYQEANRALEEKVNTFNRDTDKFNAEQSLKAQMANQAAREKSQELWMNGLAKALSLRSDVDAKRELSDSTNWSNFFESIANLGRENYALNDRDALLGADYFGVLASKPQGWSDKRWNNYVEAHKESAKRLRRQKEKTAREKQAEAKKKAEMAQKQDTLIKSLQDQISQLQQQIQSNNKNNP